MNRQEIVKFITQHSTRPDKTEQIAKQSASKRRKTRQQKDESEIGTQHHGRNLNQSHRRIGYAQPQYNPETFQKQLMAQNQGKTKESLKWRKQNLKLLEFIYYKVSKQGGIVELVSKGCFDIIAKQIRSLKEQIRHLSDEQILKIYMEHLIQLEFTSVGTPLKLKKGVDLQKTLKNALFIHESNRQFLHNKQLQQQYLNQQIVVIQNATKTLNLENITLQRINNECAHQLVELRIQNPLDFGFNPYKMTNRGDNMTIRQYCDYQKHYDDQKYCQLMFGNKLKGGKVFFAVNFEPTAGTLIQEIKQKLKNTPFGWSQPNDILSYLEQHINGCTNPQFYLKVRGVWTGGHQENVNMCAVNINHGPSDSEWYSVSGKEMQRLRKALKQQFKLDIYQNEGLWFQKINWFIENGFQIKRIIQKAGDIVISGPGTLHWVRAFGVSLHSAWNIFPQSQKMFTAAFHRQQQNLKIKFSKSNIIPLKVLTLKHIEHSCATLKQEEKHLLLMNLSKWLSEQQTLLQSIKFHHENFGLVITQKALEEHQSFCSECKQQILVYYAQNQTTNDRYCLSCIPEEQMTQQVPLYYKVDPKELFNFICQVKLNNLVNCKIKYCSSEHIGRQCVKSEVQKSSLPDQSRSTVKSGNKYESQIKIQVQGRASQTQQPEQCFKRTSNQQFYLQQEQNHTNKFFCHNKKYSQDQRYSHSSKQAQERKCDQTNSLSIEQKNQNKINCSRANYQQQQIQSKEKKLNLSNNDQHFSHQFRRGGYHDNNHYQQNNCTYRNNYHQKQYNSNHSRYHQNYNNRNIYQSNRQNSQQDKGRFRYNNNNSYNEQKYQKREGTYNYNNIKQGRFSNDNRYSNNHNRYKQARNNYQTQQREESNYDYNDRRHFNNNYHNYDQKNDKNYTNHQRHNHRGPYENNLKKFENKSPQFSQKVQEKHVKIQRERSISEISY